MYSQWERLRRDLCAQIATNDSPFDKLTSKYEPLKDFEDAEELLDFLGNPHACLDKKDSIYSCLVTEAQQTGGHEEFAAALLWLGLWPALDRIFRRHYRSNSSSDSLVSELAEQFVLVVRRANLKRISKVAATLVRNTERHLRARLRHSDNLHHPEIYMDHDALSEAACGNVLLQADESINRSVARRIRDALRPELGQDSDLLVAVALLGFSRADAGYFFGMSEAAAYKRCQRTMAHLKKMHLMKKSCPVRAPQGRV